MPKTKYYPINPDSLEGCRIRVSFHFQELQRETNPIVRANIAQYLAEAAASLALLEVKEAHKIAGQSNSPKGELSEFNFALMLINETFEQQ